MFPKNLKKLSILKSNLKALPSSAYEVREYN